MPMTGEQLRKLREQMKAAKEAIREARIDLNEAKRAGIPVEEQDKDLQRMEAALRLMTRVYGPV